MRAAATRRQRAMYLALAWVLVLGLVLTMTCRKHGQSSFSVTLGDSSSNKGYSVWQTTDGGYIITGATWSNGGTYEDLLLIKTDSSGGEEWEKTFGGTFQDAGGSVQQTSDGGYIIAGWTASYGAGDFDAWLVKTDASGSRVWDRTFGGVDADWYSSVQQTSDGGYIMAGSTILSRTFLDAWLVRTDALGNRSWERTLDGNGGDDQGGSVRKTSDGGYIVAGAISSEDTGDSAVWLVKTDSSGNRIWDKIFGGAGEDGGSSVCQTDDGGYIILGYTESFGAGSRDVWLIKANAEGDKVWDRTFGGSGSDDGYSVQQTSDGGYIIAGRTNSFGAGANDVYLIKTNGAGSQVWFRTFGGTDNDGAQSVQQTADGGYIAVGYTDSYGAGRSDVYLIKTDAEGN